MKLLYLGRSDTLICETKEGSRSVLRSFKPGESVLDSHQNPGRPMYFQSSSMLSTGFNIQTMFGIAYLPDKLVFEVTLVENAPKALVPVILTRDGERTYTVTREGLTGRHDRFVYCGELLRFSWMNQVYEFLAIGDRDDVNDETSENSKNARKLFCPTLRRYVDIERSWPDTDTKQPTYRFHSVKVVSGQAENAAGFLAKQLLGREDESGEDFRVRAEDFRRRTANCNAAQKSLGTCSLLYPEVLEADGGGKPYREPFMLMKGVETGLKPMDLKMQVEGGVNQGGLPYKSAWAILTQVAQVADAFQRNGSGHGQLIPSNILLRESGPQHQIQVTVCGFGSKSSDMVEAGFFVSDPADTESNNWIARDRFALGSLLHYMLYGKSLPPVDRHEHGIKFWTDVRLSELRNGNQIPPNKLSGVEEFLKSCWNSEGKDPFTILKGSKMRPEPSENGRTQPRSWWARWQSALWSWAAILLVVIVSFALTHYPAYQALLDGTPWGPRILNKASGFLVVLPSDTPTPAATPRPTQAPALPGWSPTKTFTPTLTSTSTGITTPTATLATPTPTGTTTPTFTPTQTHTPTYTTSPTVMVTHSPTPTTTSSVTLSPSRTPTPSRTPAPSPTATITLDARLLPSGGCGPGLELIKPIAWDVINADWEIMGAANRDLDANAVNRLPPGFARYDIWVFQISDGQRLSYQVGDNDIEQPYSPHDRSRLGWLRRTLLQQAGFRNGYAVLLLRVVFRNGNYNDCVVPIQLEM